MKSISVELKSPCCCYLEDVEFARRYGREVGRPNPSAGMSLKAQLLQSRQAMEGGSHGPVPVVIFLAGGGFRRPLVKMRIPWLTRLAEKGFLVVMPEYRGFEDSPFPGCAEDVVSAVRFVRANASRYGGDPDRIVIMGGSAGAHLALLEAYAAERFGRGDDPAVSAGVSGVIDLYGPVDLRFEGFGPGSVAERLTCCRDPERAAALLEPAVITGYISPERRLPPTLILHGDADSIVPLSQSEELYGALTRAGQDAELIVLKGAGHADMRFFEEEVQQIYAGFIRRVTK